MRATAALFLTATALSAGARADYVLTPTAVTSTDHVIASPAPYDVPAPPGAIGEGSTFAGHHSIAASLTFDASGAPAASWALEGLTANYRSITLNVPYAAHAGLDVRVTLAATGAFLGLFSVDNGVAFPPDPLYGPAFSLPVPAQAGVFTLTLSAVSTTANRAATEADLSGLRVVAVTVPEPPGWVLTGAGLMGLAGWRRLVT
jgi:hypothetical protein